MSAPFYVTTPIYYVNDAPHIGHAYTTVACDALARFARLDGRPTRFLTGCDEHGQKVERAAQAKGTEPQAFTDEVSERFRRLVAGGENVLGITNDDFIRTTEERHKRSASALWERLTERGYIYKSTYAGWYAVRDEAYYDVSELVNGKAPTGADVEWVEEESYFFKLSAMQDYLLDLYERSPDFVRPRSRLNEVISFVRGGKEKVPGALKDLSVSRSQFKWGIPVPGDDKHVMYVWIDALANYLSALGFPQEDAPLYQQFWSDSAFKLHVVGKDILRFHAVYWPAMLAAADLPIPDRVFAHGWWTIEGEKMSKSLGNVVSPDELLQAYGADRTRYFLLRETAFGSDGNFARARVGELTDTDLANKIGNLAQRSLSMIQKHFGGVLPARGAEGEALLAQAYALQARLREAFEKPAFHEAAQALVETAEAANAYIDTAAPWKLVKENKEAAGAVLAVVAECVRLIALGLQPLTPSGAAVLLSSLGVPEDSRMLSCLSPASALQAGAVLPEPTPAFPRLAV